jgi:hypothetical protein
MGKSALAKLLAVRQSNLRKALMTGLQGPDAHNFDIEKVIERLKKRRRRSSHRPPE